MGRGHGALGSSSSHREWVRLAKRNLTSRPCAAAHESTGSVSAVPDSANGTDRDVVESCGNCWFWRLPARRAQGAAVMRVSPPACHRLPPTPHIGADVGYKWPCTDKHDWCGEWRACWSDDSDPAEPVSGL